MVSVKVWSNVFPVKHLLLSFVSLWLPGALIAQVESNTALLEKTAPETVKLPTPPEKNGALGTPDEAGPSAEIFTIQSLDVTDAKSVQLQVWNPLDEPVEVKLYDLYGKRLFDESYQGTLGVQELALDFKWVPSGTYYLMVRCGAFQKMLQLRLP